VAKYNWRDPDTGLEYEPLPMPGFWQGMIAGALAEAGLILVFAFIFWVL
jgi:hypothetical protein